MLEGCLHKTMKLLLNDIFVKLWNYYWGN